MCVVFSSLGALTLETVEKSHRNIRLIGLGGVFYILPYSDFNLLSGLQFMDPSSSRGCI